MPVGLATWMLEQLTFGRDNESLSGDLLEELRGGRSAGWYFRQVSMAMGIGVCEAIREYASPLVFSAGWSALYPLWRFIGRNRLVHPAPDRWVALGWPYSTMLDLAAGILPAVTFVWLGFLVYLLLLLRLRRTKELSSFRVLGLIDKPERAFSSNDRIVLLPEASRNQRAVCSHGRLLFALSYLCHQRSADLEPPGGPTVHPSAYTPHRSKTTNPACKLRARYRIQFHSVGATALKH